MNIDSIKLDDNHPFILQKIIKILKKRNTSELYF